MGDKITKVTCKQCGAVYERTASKVPFRDNDSYNCVCGRELYSWNGSYIYSFKLLSAPGPKK
jgi:hypothetical protein